MLQCETCPTAQQPRRHRYQRHDQHLESAEKGTDLFIGADLNQKINLSPLAVRFATPVTRSSRKTRFRSVANLYRVGFQPTGSLTQFQNNFLLLIPSDQAFLAHRDLTPFLRVLIPPSPLIHPAPPLIPSDQAFLAHQDLTPFSRLLIPF